MTIERESNATMEWYPESHKIIIYPDGLVDTDDTYEMDGHTYIFSDYQYDPLTTEFTIKLKLVV